MQERVHRPQIMCLCLVHTGVHPMSQLFMFLQGTLNGKRKRGRQKKRWEDNIKEWIGMYFASSTWAAEDKPRSKGVVVKSFAVPQRPCKVMG